MFGTLLFSSCEKIDYPQDIDYKSKFSLDEVGDRALVKHDNQYLFLMLESRGPEASAKVKWWYQEGEKETFNFDQADSGIVDLFEKIEVTRQEKDIQQLKDKGSQLFIQVKDMHIEWSANRFFYLPANYSYTLFGNDKDLENISLKNIQWKTGDGIKKTSDPYGGVKPDIGKSLYEDGRPARWNFTSIPLGSTGFMASAGPYIYIDKDNQDWDYYTIDVKRPVGNTSYVFFKRDLNMNDIPAEVLNKTVEDIVEYDENLGIVTFVLGDKTYTYKLAK